MRRFGTSCLKSCIRAIHETLYFVLSRNRSIGPLTVTLLHHLVPLLKLHVDLIYFRVQHLRAMTRLHCAFLTSLMILPSEQGALCSGCTIQSLVLIKCFLPWQLWHLVKSGIIDEAKPHSGNLWFWFLKGPFWQNLAIFVLVSCYYRLKKLIWKMTYKCNE